VFDTNLDIVRNFLKQKTDDFRDARKKLEQEREQFEKEKEKWNNEKKLIR